MSAIWNRLRKFGLLHCDLPTMLWNISVMLRVLTVNIDSNYKKGISASSYLITIVTIACYTYVYLFSMMWFVFWRSTVDNDMVAAMIVLSVGIASEIGNLKLIHMCIHMDKMKKITAEYLKCDSQTIPGSRFHKNLLAALRNVKKRVIINWMVLNVNGILYLLKPVFTPGRNLPSNQFIFYGLEPMFQSPNYEIAYFVTIVSIFFVCYTPSNVSAYFIVIAGYTESQMLAMSKELVHIWSDAKKRVENEIMIPENDQFEDLNEMSNRVNKYVSKRLKEIIARHALIIDLYREVEDVYRGAIATSFILLVLGLIVTLLGKPENTYLQLPFAFMQVAMDCFTGQRVMDASVIFQQAVYDCGWENFDKANMKMVLLILQNSQKTMSLSAGGVATLSFTCLMSITKGVYSAYTALRSTVK